MDINKVQNLGGRAILWIRHSRLWSVPMTDTVLPMTNPIPRVWRVRPHDDYKFVGHHTNGRAPQFPYGAEKGKRTMFNYDTGYGNLIMECTRDIQSSLADCGGDFDFHYTLIYPHALGARCLCFGESRAFKSAARRERRGQCRRSPKIHEKKGNII